MKKIFTTLVVMMLTTLVVNAQNNTYTMVIEMQNGTKITIGPNEVKNVTFNNGEVVFSGVTLESLIDQKLENVEGLAPYFTELNSKTASLESAITALQEGLKSANTSIKDNANSLIVMSATNKALESEISTAKTTAENALKEAQTAKTKADECSSSISGLQKQISDNLISLVAKIDNVNSSLDRRITTNEGTIMTLQTSVTANSTNTKLIQDKLDQLSATDADLLNSLNSAVKQLNAQITELSEKIKKLGGE